MKSKLIILRQIAQVWARKTTVPGYTVEQLRELAKKRNAGLPPGSRDRIDISWPAADLAKALGVLKQANSAKKGDMSSPSRLTKPLFASDKERNEEIEKIAKLGAEDRTKEYSSDPSILDLYILSGGKTYNQLKAEQGEKKATIALQKTAEEGAKEEAKAIIKKKEIEHEEQQVFRSNNQILQAKYKAFRELNPDKKHSHTFKDFESQYPDQYKSLLKANQFKKEINFKTKNQPTTPESMIELGRKTFEQIGGEDLQNALKTNDSKKALRMMVLARQALTKAGNPDIAQEKAKNVKVDLSASYVQERYGTKKISTEKELKDFYQITRGKGSKHLSKIERKASRAYASKEDGLIDMGYGKARTLWHELGHHIEFESQDIADAAAEWVKKRATGAESKLNQIIPGSGYDDIETAYPDNFIHPYTGKTYYSPSGSTRATEVISMGIENFRNPENMLEFYKKDPEHFLFILGVIARQ